jgi:hypothetical protein
MKCVNSKCSCLNRRHTICPDGCRDLDRDGENCGGCGHLCGASRHCYNGKCFKISEILKQKRVEVKIPKKVVYKVKELTKDEADPQEAAEEAEETLEKLDSATQPVSPLTKTEVEPEPETSANVASDTSTTESEDATNMAKIAMKAAEEGVSS